MRKFICGLLAMGMIVIAGNVFAGEKANVVVTDSAGKGLVVKSVTLTSGSSTVASGLGTATHALFMPSTTSTGTNTATFEYTASGSDVIFYAYDSTGNTSTSGYAGTALIWGTP